MGLIVLDTSILIDNLRDTPGTGDALDEALDAGHTFVASYLTKVELLAGMRSHERKATRDLIESLDWIGVGEEISDRAGHYARSFRRSHQGIDVVDFVVAATADVTGGALWTRNVKHFPMFPELAPPY